jgi:hypothetical protein
MYSEDCRLNDADNTTVARFFQYETIQHWARFLNFGDGHAAG